jgi:Spy/CpxP family protein refolding chaperone
MMADLGITQEQGQKLRTINETMKGKMQAIRTDNSLTKEQKRAQVQALNEAHDAEVKTILTPEQFAKWSAARQERLAERKDKRGGGQKN